MWHDAQAYSSNRQSCYLESHPHDEKGGHKTGPNSPGFQLEMWFLQLGGILSACCFHSHSFPAAPPAPKGHFNATKSSKRHSEFAAVCRNDYVQINSPLAISVTKQVFLPHYLFLQKHELPKNAIVSLPGTGSYWSDSDWTCTCELLSPRSGSSHTVPITSQPDTFQKAHK